MSHDNGIRPKRHGVFNLHVHLIFVAKYRRRVFDSAPIEIIRQYIEPQKTPH